MYKITRVEDKNEQEKLCALCGVEYDPDMLCYKAHDDDDFTGIVLFRIIGKCAVIFDILPKSGTYDENSLFLLGKTALNFVDLCGIKSAKYLGGDEKIAGKLEFVKKDGEYILDLTGYFENPCERHKN